MATFRKRNGKWQVQIRRISAPPISRTFTSKSDANSWARSQEHAIEIGDVFEGPSRSIPLEALLDRYVVEVIPMKRTDSTEESMVRILKADPMAKKTLSSLSSNDVARFRDARLATSKPSTVVRQMSVLRHAIRIARDEWGWKVPYEEVHRVRMPQILNSPIERVTDAELSSFLAVADRQANPHLAHAVRLALATAMRRGELLALMSDDVNLAEKRLVIRMSKNGHSRVVPLSHEACRLLEGAADGPVVPMKANCLKLAFARAKRRAGTLFRFHDLRHEAISRLFELGLTLPEVQLISGHRTLSQLSRYSHPAEQRIRDKFDNSVATRI